MRHEAHDGDESAGWSWTGSCDTKRSAGSGGVRAVTWRARRVSARRRRRRRSASAGGPLPGAGEHRCGGP
jgi:hypothetical protein